MKVIQFMASQKWGGAEKVFVEISNELAKEHNVIAFLLRGTEYRKRFSKQVNIIQLKSHPTRHNPLLLLELFNVIRKTKADIIHTHAAKASELIHTLDRFIECKHIGTKHNARKGKVFNSLRWVTAVSKDARCSVRSKKKSTVKIIYNGLNPQETQKFPKNDIFSLLAVGRLEKVKGFDILIEQLATIDINFELSILGEGREAKKLNKQIDRSGLTRSILLDGFCNDIANAMIKSDLIVISSHSEGFPNVFVEALFFGNVLISTPVGGVTEVLPKQFLAVQNRLGEKIKDVHDNYSVYHDNFRKLKQSKAKFFTLDRIIKHYESFYMDMLK